VATTAAILCLTYAGLCHGAVIFEESFDGKPDWNMDGSKFECNIGTCTDSPENWNYYRQTNGFGQPTIRIFNQADHTTGSGKAFIVYSESNPKVNWPSDAQLSKVFPEDYQELYWRAWIKTQGDWQSAANSMFKVLRTTHYDRNGNFYEYFGSGNSSPTFLIELGTSPRHGTDFIPAYRCDPQSSNYYCQPPYNMDIFTKLGSTGQAPTSQGMYADGHWHRYDIHVKMNTQTGSAWNKDGIAEFWYDGVLKMSHNNVQWKYPGSAADVGWNSVTIGGNANNSFSSQGEQWYAIDDVVVSTTPIPDNYVMGAKAALHPGAMPIVLNNATTAKR
jgi:hypothetical protein